MDRSTFTALAAARGGPLVSIYAPMQVRGPETRENRIRFKTRVRDAHDKLAAAGVRDDAADDLLAPAERLIDDRAFWQHQDEGLALFLGADGQEVVHMSHPPVDASFVGTRFHLRPLVPELDGGGRYHLLVADLGGVQLYRASRSTLEPIGLPDGTPTSLEEATRFDEHEASLQHHGDARTGAGGHGAPQGIVHGSGDSDRDKKGDIRRWFTWLDDGVRAALANEPDRPLLFVGVDYLFPIYRDADRSGALLERPLVGAPDARDEAQLLADAWELVEPEFDRPRIEAMQRVAQAQGTGRATNALEELVPAAAEGRVDTLIVGNATARWGRYDPKARSVVLSAHDGSDVVDLLDRATVDTVLHGGRAWVVPDEHVPDGADAVALLRY